MTSPAWAGYSDAADRVSLAYARGDGLDAISAREGDRSAWQLSEAATPDGQEYAREYDDTTSTLISDLRADEAEAGRDRTPGTPHPDPAMAALGWQTCGHGIYTREGDAGLADVRALERYAADREAG